MKRLYIYYPFDGSPEIDYGRNSDNKITLPHLSLE